jgi:hypothetical protein
MSIIRFYNVPATSEYFAIGTACSEALTTANYYMSTGYVRGQGAQSVFGTLEGADLRFKINGSAPATSCGHIWYKGDSIFFDDLGILQNLQLLNEAALATAYVHFTYFYG